MSLKCVISESPVCQIRLLDDRDSLQQFVGIQKLDLGYSRSISVFPVVRGPPKDWGPSLRGCISDRQHTWFSECFPGSPSGTDLSPLSDVGFLPESLNLGIGRKLKLEQREEAPSRSISL